MCARARLGLRLGLAAFLVGPALVEGCSNFSEEGGVFAPAEADAGGDGRRDAPVPIVSADAGDGGVSPCPRRIHQFVERFDGPDASLKAFEKREVGPDGDLDVTQGLLEATLNAVGNNDGVAVARHDYVILDQDTLRAGRLRFRVTVPRPIGQGFAEIGCSLTLRGSPSSTWTKLSFRLESTNSLTFVPIVQLDGGRVDAGSPNRIGNASSAPLDFELGFRLRNDGGGLEIDPRVDDSGVPRVSPHAGRVQQVELRCGLDIASIPDAAAPFRVRVDDVELDICGD